MRLRLIAGVAVATLIGIGRPGTAPAQTTIRIDGTRLQLRQLDRQLRQLAAATPRIAGAVTSTALAAAAQAAQLGRLGSLSALEALGSLGSSSPLRHGSRTIDDRDPVPPQAWIQGDPADSLYREGRSALRRSNYSRAAYLFSQIHQRHPRSTYTPDAYYWEALALYRTGTEESLTRARSALNRQKSSYPDARTRDDAADLMGRVNAELAKRGDETATQEVIERADEAVATPTRPSRPTASQSGRIRCRDDDDEKVAALNALLQMDEDRALPLLKRVMARRDDGSVCLRRKAVFLISQHSGEESEAMLLAAVRSDPDREVREQAVFWLGQSGGEAAAGALDSILRSSDDEAVQDKAIFALSQNSSPRALQSLRDYAMKAGASIKLREQAIFWLGQSNRGDNVEFLRSIYRTVRERELKDKIIFSISQGGGREAQRWLAEVAGDANEPIDARKSAIFWLSQSGAALPELFTLYDRMADREIREQLIFAYSQRRERGAVDKLVEIARSDPDRELRKKAIFWLGQSKDPRVPQIIEDILSKP
jgi:TolA-binding protein